MNELVNEIVSELHRHLDELREPISTRGMAANIAAARPDVMRRLEAAFGSREAALEAIKAVIVESLDRSHTAGEALRHADELERYCERKFGAASEGTRQ